MARLPIPGMPSHSYLSMKYITQCYNKYRLAFTLTFRSFTET